MPDSPTVDEGTSSVPAVADVKPAESSTAEVVTQNKGVENKSMLEAVTAALKPGPDKSPESVTQDPNADSTTGDPEAKPDENGGFTPEEFKQLSRNSQRRIRELANGNRSLDARVKEMEPKAQNFDRINDLM